MTDAFRTIPGPVRMGRSNSQDHMIGAYRHYGRPGMSAQTRIGLLARLIAGLRQAFLLT